MNDEHLIDLLGESVRGAALYANDEFFAEKENLVKAATPVFIEDKFTDRGKWMDGWETRRRRQPGDDWCILRLGIPGRVHKADINTKHFRGNYPEQASLEGCVAAPQARLAQLEKTRWFPLLQRSPLAGDGPNLFELLEHERVTHVRLRIFPDGGVARLRLWGEARPDWDRLQQHGQVDLASLEHGGVAIACSDMFFGNSNNMLQPGWARNMGDGWENRRRRDDGHDWVVVKLGRVGNIERVVVDTMHFKGNAPDQCGMDVAHIDQNPWETPTSWTNLFDGEHLLPHTEHVFEQFSPTPATHVRLRVHPDGGIARLRVYGRL